MLELVLTTIFVYLVYYLWITFNFDNFGNLKIRGRKNKNKNNLEKKMPSEVKFFVNKYNIDLQKVNYKYFLQVIGLVVAIDFAIIANIVIRIKALWLQILLIFVLVIVLTLLSFEILGRYFKKKGLTKNENNKRNRK